MNFFARPNMAGIDNGWYDNYFVDSPTSYNQNQIDARYDQNITDKDRLYLTYRYLNSNSLVTDPFHDATVGRAVAMRTRETKKTRRRRRSPLRIRTSSVRPC